MGRQNKDPAVAGSSIVLLQERFKQLQRLKEMREERQLLSLLPQSADSYIDESAKLGMNFSTSSEAVFRDPLALGLNSNSANYAAHFRTMKPHQQFPSPASARGPRGFFEKTDVDTSLRL